MESQRTIIEDLLDGAQGLTNCTEPPFAQECDIAVNSVAGWLRDVYKQWRLILSHSVLLQSIGSLLSTILDKVMIGIEDMSDISEAESQRLTDFCNRVAALEDLFTPEILPSEAAHGEAPISLTAVYTPRIKFQYLTNILESSLVDIK